MGRGIWQATGPFLLALSLSLLLILSPTAAVEASPSPSPSVEVSEDDATSPSPSPSPLDSSPPPWVAAIDDPEGGLTEEPHSEEWFQKLDEHLIEELKPRIEARAMEAERVQAMQLEILAESNNDPYVAFSLAMPDSDVAVAPTRKKHRHHKGGRHRKTNPEVVGAAPQTRRRLLGLEAMDVARRRMQELPLRRYLSSKRKYSDPFVQGVSDAWVLMRSAFLEVGKLKNAALCKRVLPQSANAKGTDYLTQARRAYGKKDYPSAKTAAARARNLGMLCQAELKKRDYTRSPAYKDLGTAFMLINKALEGLGKKTRRSTDIKKRPTTGPGNVKCDCTVAQDGSGNTKSVQDAINRYKNNKRRVVICVKPGKYTGQITVPAEAQYITLQGLGPARSVRITDNKNQDNTGSPTLAATIVIKGAFFSAKSISFENTFFSCVVPAPAAAVLAGYATFYDVVFLAWMDTVCAIVGAQYYSGCMIEGKTDIYWGSARTVFEDGELFDRFVLGYQGYLTAQGSDDFSRAIDKRDGGFIIKNSKIGGKGPCMLGRPYRKNALVGYFNCELGNNILPEHWEDWFGNYNSGQVYFYEYKNTGPGASDPGARRLVIDVDDDTVEKYSSKNFISTVSGWA